jgi:hypothetical protein
MAGRVKKCENDRDSIQMFTFVYEKPEKTNRKNLRSKGICAGYHRPDVVNHTAGPGR